MSTLAGSAGVGSHADGSLSAARFRNPHGICLDSTGQYLYVADVNNHVVRKIDTFLNTVATYAGVVQDIPQGSATPSYLDGSGTTAKFNQPYAVGINKTGELFVTDQENHVIRKINTAKAVSTWAGKAGTTGIQNGTADAAYFWYPTGLAVDKDDNVYVSDYWSDRIRKGTPARVVTTPAGNNDGDADGTGAQASFKGLGGVAVDKDGNLYIADGGSNKIKKMSPEGVVTTLAGSGAAGGLIDGPGSTAAFNNPFGVAVDSDGNVFVADTGNNAIRKISPDGLVTTIAGTGTAGSADGAGFTATFRGPTGIAVSASGKIYVADCDNHTIRKLQLQ